MATINNSTPGNRPVNDGELTVDITRPNRQMNDAHLKEVEARRIRDAEEQARKTGGSNRPDRVEVSSDARLMLAQSQESGKSDAAERKQRVAELREQYLDGTLATKARVEKAASSLLGA